MTINPLTIEQLKVQAPALFTEQQHHKLSNVYHFIPTIEIVKEIISHNWHPVSVSQANVRDKEKEGYQTHLVKFQHFDDLLTHNDNAVELLLFNNHSGNKSFSIGAGIYRFICANGLVVADSIFETYKIKHLGDRDNDVATAIDNITKIKSKLMNKINQFESIELSQGEKESFAKSSIPLRFDKHLEIEHNDLLIPNRDEDTKDDLYTVLNVIQENLLRGNIAGINKNTGRRFTSKEITSINKDVDINKSLWDIAERIVMIKEPSLALAS